MAIYFDHNATTPLDPRVVEEMARSAPRIFANPSSIHAFGREARRAIEEARARLGALFGIRPRDLVFTASATEANNLAIFGLAAARGGRRRIVASPIEHPSVLEPIRRLATQGYELTWLPVSRAGVVDVAGLAEQLDDDVAFVALMWANNETGAIQPVAAAARVCREKGVPLHVDAVQAAGKIPVSIEDVPAATMSFSAHKIHGPRGAAALSIAAGTRLVPQLIGGSQERDRRAGTENIAAILGFVRAAELAVQEMVERTVHLRELETRLRDALRDAWPDSTLNTGAAARIPGTMNLLFGNAAGELLMMNLDLKGIAVSHGSACSSGAIEPSQVLKAMGLDTAQNMASLRVSMAKTNTPAEVDAFASALAEIRRRGVADARGAIEIPAPKKKSGGP